ncbi:MAG: hypothetical protein HGA87_00245 [Desulfobulbaceae bacterium]|nr:hypothetical protein [Desulfobulbaceae bacterium]
MDLTKKYRCVADADKKAKIDPYTEMIGVTGATLPYTFDTDDLDEMRQYVEDHGITFEPEDSFEF